MNPSDVFIDQYRTAAGEGAVLELKMRLLADKVAALQPYVDEKLEQVEDHIISLFKKDLQASEAAQLRLCRQLRNKVLHCDFPRARSTLHQLGSPQIRAGIRQIQITNPTGEGILQHLVDAASNKPGAFRQVADLTGKSEAKIFGWLLELGAAGDFSQAAEVFRAASAIVERLLEVAD
jgi:hypothetical protein